MPTATTSKQSTSSRRSNAPRNTNEFGNIRVACPVYVGVTTELAKTILEALREKCGEHPASPGMSFSSISVEHSGLTTEQAQLEQRLRIDLKTLRPVLFDSWSRGLNLDLALRIQREIADKVQFIDRQTVDEAISSSLDHYDYFVDNNA